jgi:hypothetical protein
LGKHPEGEVSTVERLKRELEKLRRGAGLREETERLDARATFLKQLAATIRGRAPEDGAEPLIDATEILSETGQALPNDDRRVFNMMFGIDDDGKLSPLEARRSTLANSLRVSYSKMQRWENRVLGTVARSIIGREQEVRLTKREQLVEGPDKPSDLNDLFVERIEATLVLGEDGIAIQRRMTFTIRAVRDLEDHAVAECSGNNFNIDEPVGCDVRETAVLREALERVEELERYAADIYPIQAEPRKQFELAVDVGALLGRLRRTLGVDLVHMGWIRLPPLRAGQSWTFSYRVTCSEDQASYVVFGGQSYGLKHGPLVESPDTWRFSLGAGSMVARVKLAVKSPVPLTITPYTPETFRLMSGFIRPAGLINYLRRNAEGIYENTFFRIEPMKPGGDEADTIGLVWKR